MSGKRYPNLSMVEYQEIWRNHTSAEEEAACGFFDRFRKGPADKKDEAPNAGVDEKDKKSAVSDKDLYPPIVTIDGRVDTDIDHLIEDLADEYKGPVDDIPSKFPKPHVFSVIEGSLDDDVDSYANDDGTMEHTLVDAPKSFNRNDLKDVASNDASRTPGHSKSGQMEASHTDRSHNKMNVEPLDNERGHDDSRRKEPSRFLQTGASQQEQQNRGHVDQRRNTDYPGIRDEKSQLDGARKLFTRNAGRKQTVESSKRKNRNGEDITMQKSLPCLDHNRDHLTMNLMKSESADGHYNLYNYRTVYTDADQPLDSRPVVLTQCDSSVHITEVRDCSSYKDSRPKDTESAVCTHAYTESLTCTFTDESFRDGHASLDMSALRADHDHSQSLSETESVSELQVTGTPRRLGQLQMYESYDYNLDTKAGADFEHKLYHFPSYSEDSLTKSSELYPRSRYLTHSTSHLSSSQAQSGLPQTRPNSDPANFTVSTKSSNSCSQNAAVCGFHSESCQNQGEKARLGEDSILTRMKYKSDGQPPYPHAAYQENTPVHPAYLDGLPVSTSYHENTSVLTGGVRRSSSKEPHPFDNGKLPVNEPIHCSREDVIPMCVCPLDTTAQDVMAGEQRKTPQKLLEESHSRLRELEGQLASLNTSREFDQIKIQSHSVAVGTPKEYRSTSTQNEMAYKESAPLSSDFGIQVTIEACQRKEAETNRWMIQPPKPQLRDRHCENIGDSDPTTVDKSRKLHIQPDQLTCDMSDTESLDSEANYLLHQLQMAQMTKRKANILLKHVQNILEQTDKVGDTPVTIKREMDESRREASTEAERNKFNNKSDPTAQEVCVETSPSITSMCATMVAERRNEVRDLELSRSPTSELKPPSLSQAEAGDRGLVQKLVNTWDKHHRAVLQGKADSRSTAADTGSQTKSSSSNRCYRKQSGEHRDGSEHINLSDYHQWKHQATSGRPVAPSTQLNKAIERAQDKPSLTQEGEMTEKRARRHSFERSLRCQKNVKNEPLPGPMATSTNIAYDSTSLASVSMDSVRDNKQAADKHPESSKHAYDDVEKRVASLPRKLKHKQRTSPELYSRKDARKSKWRYDIDPKRIKARSSSIKDSLRVAFKVAEESMTAAARVAQALNIVMKASLISPPSSSSVEGKYTRSYGRENKSPAIKSRRPDLVTANSRSKTKPSAAHQQSPDDISLCLRTNLPTSRHKARKLDIFERSEKKKRSSHSYSTSRERSVSHKTSLSSPLRGDTFSRKPKSVRASNHQPDTKGQIPEPKEAHSKSCVTLSEISPLAWGDSRTDHKDVSGQTQLISDQQMIIQVAYSSSPECACPQQQNVQTKEALQLDPPLKNDQNCVTNVPMANFDSEGLLARSKVDDQEGHLSNLHGVDKKYVNETPVKSECEQSSILNLSKEEWTIPNSKCRTGRNMDNYFTQKTPLIDQNLQSISLSAKQIIRRQLVGSCVDPGCTDSACSDSVESNSNFNRSAASRQLHLNIARKLEQQKRERRLNTYIMNKCREEMELSQCTDPFIIWQCDASLQYESECYPSDTNVFLQPDRGKPSSAIGDPSDSPQAAYRTISRSHEESNTSRLATVYVHDTLRTSYQLHEEEILHIEDNFVSSCTNQEVGPCVATLCYTDLSSPALGCFNLLDYGSTCADLPDQAETLNTAEVDVSQEVEFDSKYEMLHDGEFNWKYPLQQTRSDNQQTFPDGGNTMQCPPEPSRGQSTPAPKPRARKLQVSDSDSFPLPGRTAQITRFSPIFEELCPEEVAYGADQMCPEFRGRSKNVNSSSNNSRGRSRINNSSRNINRSSSRNDNNSSSRNNNRGRNNSNSRNSANNNNSNNAVDVELVKTMPCPHTSTSRESAFSSSDSRLAESDVSPHGNTSKSLEIQHGSVELNYIAKIESLTWPLLISNVIRGGSAGLGCGDMLDPHLGRTSAGVHSPAGVSELQVPFV